MERVNGIILAQYWLSWSNNYYIRQKEGLGKSTINAVTETSKHGMLNSLWFETGLKGFNNKLFGFSFLLAVTFQHW
jgi:hypothetical protein